MKQDTPNRDDAARGRARAGARGGSSSSPSRGRRSSRGSRVVGALVLLALLLMCGAIAIDWHGARGRTLALWRRSLESLAALFGTLGSHGAPSALGAADGGTAAPGPQAPPGATRLARAAHARPAHPAAAPAAIPEARPAGVAPTSTADALQSRAAMLAQMRLERLARTFCYQRALLRDPNLTGRLDVRMTVQASGRVDTVQTTPTFNSDSPAAQDFRACVERNLRGQQLPPPPRAPALVAFALTVAPGQ